MSSDYINFLKTRKYHNNSSLSNLMGDSIVNNTSNSFLMTYNSNRYKNVEKYYLNKMSYEITKSIINSNIESERYNSINSIVFEPIGKSLIFGTSNGSLFNYDIGFENKAIPTKIFSVHNPIKCLLYSQCIYNFSNYSEIENNNNRFSNNILISGDSKGELVIHFLDKSEKKENFVLHSQSITDMTFSLNESIIASSSEDKIVKIFDLQIMKEIISYNEHTSDVKTVDWAKPKSIIASSGKDKKIKFFDCRSKNSFETMNNVHFNIINKLRFNSNCNYLVTASKEHNLKLIDMRMMKEIQKFDHHTKGVNAVAWNPSNSNSFCSIGEDKKIIHWYVDSEKFCSVDDAHNEEIFSLCYHPNGSSLYTGSKFSSIKFWVN